MWASGRVGRRLLRELSNGFQLPDHELPGLPYHADLHRTMSLDAGTQNHSAKAHSWLQGNRYHEVIDVAVPATACSARADAVWASQDATADQLEPTGLSQSHTAAVPVSTTDPGHLQAADELSDPKQRLPILLNRPDRVNQIH